MRYNKTGTQADEKDVVFAECVDGSVQKKYYVLTYNNSIYDPNGPDSHRENTLDRKLKNTSKATFDYYVNYLSSRNPIYFRRAERSFIND